MQNRLLVQVFQAVRNFNACSLRKSRDIFKTVFARSDAAEKMGWYVVKCNDGDSPRSIESIGDEIYSIISTEVL